MKPNSCGKLALPDYICNTSPFQHLHQLGCLEILPTLFGRVVVPHAVLEELQIGQSQGCDVPDLTRVAWVKFRQPASAPSLPLAAYLGRGESSVLALALESKSPLIILDDGIGRRAAELLRIPLTGTLGLLLDAKKIGLISAVLPLLDHLDRLRFRVSATTRTAVLKLAGE